MSSAQAEAARRNARLSTGPKSVLGKAASSRNATRHGVLSARPVLPDEDPVELELLTQRLTDAYAPEGPTEELLLAEIVGTTWRLRRVELVEASLFALGGSQPVVEALRQGGEASAVTGAAWASQSANFSVLGRYEITLSNRLRRALKDLERLQAERRAMNAELVVIGGER